MKKIQLILTMLVLGVSLTLTSCLKQEFDAPPDMTGYDPGLPVNMRIDSLKILMASSGIPRKIDSNWTISGIVTADDRSGNFYKQIVIEDSTGAIHVLIEANSLYTKYPVGRKVYIKLQGLYFGYYAKLPQLGYVPDATGSMTNIPPAVLDKHIVRANFPNEVPVTTFEDLSQLKTVNNAMINRLVEINNVQIAMADTNKTYAQPSALASATNVNIEDCNGNKMIIRTSGYASFQPYNLPNGKGKLTAVYTVFNNTPQLVIRDTNDLKFHDERCGANAPMITLDSMRKRFTGTQLTLGDALVKGVVISDRASGNINSQNLVLQDGNRGIVIRFGSNHTFDLGDSLVINVSGGALGEFNSLLQISGIDAGNVSRIATGKTVTPQVVTLGTLTGAAFESYESTLVKVMNVTTTAIGTYSGNKTITDGTGTIVLYTANSATFATSPMFTGIRTITGVVGQFGATKQIQLRNLSDVQ